MSIMLKVHVQAAAMQASSVLHHSPIAVSITRWSRPSHSSTHCHSSFTSWFGSCKRGLSESRTLHSRWGLRLGMKFWRHLLQQIDGLRARCSGARPVGKWSAGTQKVNIFASNFTRQCNRVMAKNQMDYFYWNTAYYCAMPKVRYAAGGFGLSSFCLAGRSPPGELFSMAVKSFSVGSRLEERQPK